MTSIEIDPYEILQVQRNATDREIKVAYKKLALINHPDRSDNPNETMMAQINEAYAILSDPEQRRCYDLAQTKQGFHTYTNSGMDRRDSMSRQDFRSRRTHNNNMHHFTRNPFPPEPFTHTGDLSNQNNGNVNKGFTFSFTSTSRSANGESKSVRKTTRYRDGKKETVIETVTIKPDGTREYDKKTTTEDVLPFLGFNPFGKLMQWIQCGKNDESHTAQQHD